MKAPKKKRSRKSGATAGSIQRKPGNEPFFQSDGNEHNFFARQAKTTLQNDQLPADLRSTMETAFGQDFSEVNIHQNSGQAAELNALAFTRGDEVHFAPGQFNPQSEKGRNLIGHEFTHVAQQRSGAVSPTEKAANGMLVNADKGLETQADQIGRKAILGERVNSFGSSAGTSAKKTAQAKSNVVQMAKSDYGVFDPVAYTELKDKAKIPKAIGVEMYLKFKPGTNVDAKSIGMIQSVRSVDKGVPIAIENGLGQRMISAADAKKINSPVKGTDEGIHMDQYKEYRNPLYATGATAKKDTKLTQTSTPEPVKALSKTEKDNDDVTGRSYGGWGKHGYRYKSGENWVSKNAELHDTPMLPNRTKNAEQLFETSALALDGVQKGMYYGSVEWGWRTDSKGVFTKIPFTTKSAEVPTSSFMKAGEIWNKGKSTAGEKNIKMPVGWTGTINTNLSALRSGKSAESALLADLPKGLKVTVLDASSGWHYIQIDAKDAGITMNATGKGKIITGNLLKGYVSKELITKDAAYVR